MGRSTQNLSKKIAQYEYEIIKNQLESKNEEQENRLPSFSCQPQNIATKNKIFSPWQIDHKLQIIHTKNEDLKESCLNPQKTSALIWIGNSKHSVSYALLYLILENFKTGTHKKVSQQNCMVLKKVLYNVAEHYFNNQEKQNLVEGLCLLQYHSASLSQFFFKHQNFEKVCLRMISCLVDQNGESQHQIITQVLSKINQFVDAQIREIVPLTTSILDSDLMYTDSNDILESDFVIEVNLLQEKKSYIIGEKGCVFVYEIEQSNDILLKKQVVSPRRRYLRQTASPTHIQKIPLFEKINKKQSKRALQIYKDIGHVDHVPKNSLKLTSQLQEDKISEQINFKPILSMKTNPLKNKEDLFNDLLISEQNLDTIYLNNHGEIIESVENSHLEEGPPSRQFYSQRLEKKQIKDHQKSPLMLKRRGMPNFLINRRTSGEVEFEKKRDLGSGSTRLLFTNSHQIGNNSLKKAPKVFQRFSSTSSSPAKNEPAY